MVNTKFYYPENTGIEKRPAVVGMPGFVGSLHRGRIEQLFEDLTKQGVICMGMMYDGIEEKGDKVVCDFNLNRYIQNMRDSFEELSDNPKVNKNKVGVIASSISGSVFAYGLTNHGTNGIFPRSYVSISPLVGWPYFGTVEQRLALQTARDKKLIDDFEITSVYDAQRGIKRVIPIRCLEEIESIDGLRELRKYHPGLMEVMTLVGALDDRASPASMRKYHERLGGTPDTLINYDDEGHAIPIEKMREPIIKFLGKTLEVESLAA